ncbi:hypothetical protein P167DRAFT_533156 [Morchella conica CCBAS932]|uniref:Uncharacterized protein n=1 Tax=Morchella conica CCBAS932 TaxID=1392247 RepID=A0A3N4KXS5_9PEZI|nr:hypothetical protein P167DRAFT_533156 [Morchella conica CCBAS932]
MAPPVVPRAVTRWPVVKSPAGTVFNPLFFIFYFLFISKARSGQAMLPNQTKAKAKKKKS